MTEAASILEAAGQIVNMAETAWKIIDAGRPSSEITGTTANAVPNVSDWTNLQAGTARKVSWSIKYKNLYEVEVVAITFEIHWQYGATYMSGGAYIPNLWLSVPKCDIEWGYSADIAVTVRNPSNAGTTQAPVAKLPLTVSGTVATPIRSRHVEWNFEFEGDADWRQL